MTFNEEKRKRADSIITNSLSSTIQYGYLKGLQVKIKQFKLQEWLRSPARVFEILKSK